MSWSLCDILCVLCFLWLIHNKSHLVFFQVNIGNKEQSAGWVSAAHIENCYIER